MKKLLRSLVLFAVGFAAAYLAMCYLVPGLRIKLSAPPAEYFRESVQHMVLFKAAVSLLVGAAAAALPLLFKRR